ncbi:NAD(P)-dependent dehydrogenase (short-subunit alcohol dehydrogenase family) [Pseudomonas sp. TE6288]|jgi:NAD(P)-dependent dehydrogenase (short-subunit alcohol dehydrogenase family)|uniref:SDR family oxidoreductase n=1 Tax=Pseudomonas soli TaxID=1306993 RepID=A0A1H9NKK1_9PSED|nr:MULTISPECIES: SDR family oxidoreductase [Pseudomonas]AUY35781.1 short-chain dehydrogenase [Pseudomonas sp. PONIH3]MBI6953707.1 SDR family oxidoreductase [Pseudomonas sp. CCOS 191]MCX5507660.1 SDR family oxidoreductase [Pseudomonas sp. BJa3]MDT3716528.1 SDR family oxidoreductase [Pseudomonas soli]MDT3733261.1 SDR family oxidoreductase [Pseudomonas soli]
MPTVLITGCSSGIGRALADAFRDAGHEVWATARKPDDVDALLAAGFAARQLDVNDGEALTRLADELEDRHGGLDILINNAGYGAMGPLLDGGVEAMRQQFETNVFALVGVTRALFPLLRRSRGLVVNIGSVSGVLVTPFAGAYCASKAAVHGLTDALRLELAPFGIRVMEVQPGAIASQFASNAQQQAEQVLASDSPWWPLREQVQARARASQDRPTSAAVFAQRLLAATRKSPVPALVRIGNGSTALPLMARVLPQRLLDWVLRKRFGLLRPL